ncbi:MAG: hypothetical protein GEV11_26870 [Streptosporangiales bacterium]|nr:hypothetical protein [Streptosporangiales bacterium]
MTEPVPGGVVRPELSEAADDAGVAYAAYRGVGTELETLLEWRRTGAAELAEARETLRARRAEAAEAEEELDGLADRATAVWEHLVGAVGNAAGAFPCPADEVHPDADPHVHLTRARGLATAEIRFPVARYGVRPAVYGLAGGAALFGAATWVAAYVKGLSEGLVGIAGMIVLMAAVAGAPAAGYAAAWAGLTLERAPRRGLRARVGAVTGLAVGLGWLAATLL